MATVRELERRLKRMENNLNGNRDENGRTATDEWLQWCIDSEELGREKWRQSEKLNEN